MRDLEGPLCIAHTEIHTSSNRRPWFGFQLRCVDIGADPVSPTPRITHAEINGVDSFEIEASGSTF